MGLWRRRRPLVFVAMPYAPEFDGVYDQAIEPACTAAGADCLRLDKDIFYEHILVRLYEQLRRAQLVIVDLSGRNPNVFYEAGLAHALGKKVILLTQDPSAIPFDLREYPHEVYAKDPSKLEPRLRKRIGTLLSDKTVATSPFGKRAVVTWRSALAASAAALLGLFCVYLWYVYPLPMPVVAASDKSLTLVAGEKRTVTFRIRNLGGPSTVESYFTASVSPGLDIVDYSAQPPTRVRVVNQQPGEAISAEGADVAAQFEMFDCYKRYGRREALLVRLVIQAKNPGQHWLRYRAAFDSRKPGYDFIRFPAEAPLKDQQGYPVLSIDVIAQRGENRNP